MKNPQFSNRKWNPVEILVKLERKKLRDQSPFMLSLCRDVIPAFKSEGNAWEGEPNIWLTLKNNNPRAHEPELLVNTWERDANTYITRVTSKWISPRAPNAQSSKRLALCSSLTSTNAWEDLDYVTYIFMCTLVKDWVSERRIKWEGMNACVG